MLLSDMLDTEKLCNVKILPSEALDPKAITLLSQSELELDLEEMGKFNKRSSEALRAELIN